MAIMVGGNIILGIGIGLFKVSLLGNDPSTAMVISIAEIINIDFSIVIWFVNCFWFLIQLFLGRQYIGAGTFVNWLCVGVIASGTDKIFRAFWDVSGSFPWRILIMGIGVLVLSLGASLYQTADIGIAPYDSISIILAERTGRKYFWCRMITDAFCTTIALILGGIVGLGTLVCALGLGPFIAFFNRTVSGPLLMDKK